MIRYVRLNTWFPAFICCCFVIQARVIDVAPDSFLDVSSIDLGMNEDERLGKQAIAIQQMGQMPLAFTENRGQWDVQALFKAYAGTATMWFTREGTYYLFTRRIPRTSDNVGGP